MNRKCIILLSIVVASIGAIAPIASVMYFSWDRAVAGEQERLTEIADRAIERTRRSFDEIDKALRVFEKLDVPPCSAAHIELMRKITTDSRTLDEIGYFENGKLKCSSWGITQTDIDLPAPDFTAADGLAVTLNVYPKISNGNLKTALRYKNHDALADPRRFVDIVADGDIQLAVATENGLVLGTLHEPDQALVNRVLKDGSTQIAADKWIVVHETSGLKAVVIEQRSRVLERLRRQQMLMLPVGMVLAALFVALVGWLSRRRLSARGELAAAVRRREFVAHYQPLIELKTGRCVGAEALVRWRQPNGALVGPDSFIPLAEESGLILPITDQVVRTTIAELGALLEQNRSLHIAINLSAQDIRTGRILDFIDAALKGTGIAADQIWLEATERGFMDVTAARATLERARASGYAVVIDDFGTGYSSLSYLQDLPLDALKIDKSFIDTVCTDSATSSVTPHIIDMAKTLKLKIVAEGIEHQAQADYLLAREVEYGQGWLFSKALPVTEFVAFYRANVSGL
ncbi:MAG: hypothetical protein JWP38_968 [Herbaspirillum sp.]|jgi:sensor c-di-GMP phosphodiesterase-like protein|nr:hypothetical protein [Herbaspirillum sp.]